MPSYNWIPFYEELATSLIQYKNNRSSLLKKCEDVFSNISLPFPKIDDGEPTDIDPFTFFGFFNKGITLDHRIELLSALKTAFELSSEVPTNFEGIPLLHNLSASFFSFKDERQDDDIDNLWQLFISALNYADNECSLTEQLFIESFNEVHDQKRISYNITMGLFWIRPNAFPPLDRTSRKAIIEKDLITSAENRLKRVPNGQEYLTIKRDLLMSLHGAKTFAELSSDFWDEHIDTNVNYWTYAPGENASKWNAINCDTNNQIPQIELDDTYKMQDFISQVFMSKEHAEKLVHLLKNKKNVILQGAPGVGKTFAAKRLAYLLTGTKNKSQIELVQFHQNYSYEDFIRGYRPTKNGFELTDGIFYDFCKRAEQDPNNRYCFIIDEINRGNLSKIMGELFMLLEADKRGEQIKLAYGNELFTVPENVYLIGTMNTADRSLALIDYALRRRFAFYKLSPAFNTAQFKKYIEDLNSSELVSLIGCIQALNAAILTDDSLGEGFCIGHSYFCNMTKDTICHDQLEDTVQYEIIPLLEEYWFDEKEKVEEWSAKLINAIRS